ncbi:MAG TPA: 3-phosphoshikimate 1-carboxyvinyltransferase [Candidatus Binataceae bacterium]|nr:3-phosphoshikimate 1-carboxyvinyltransferase [Candidatus Binataceae bacterium]
MPTDEIEIHPPGHPLDATVSVPGSKSITNRAMILAAMADGRSVIEAVLISDDTREMAEALRTLGFVVAIDEAKRRITVEGRGGAIAASRGELDVGGAGTAMRFLAGFVTIGRGRFRIDGNQRMRQRPIGALIDALRALGADARSELGNGCPPIVIDTTAQAFEGGEATIDASLSSQFVSALLMPAPVWRKGLRLTVVGDTARPFIEMTLKLMERWGAQSSVEGETITVPGGQRYRSCSFRVEPDASSASYFAAAAALVGGRVTISGLTRDSTQGDIGVLAILERMGARVAWNPDSVTVSGDGRLAGVDVAMNSMPDMVATVAAIAPFASTPTRIRKVGFIRHHESDRIRALATELRRLGATVAEFDDGLEVAPSALCAAAVETYDDHRIAMAFAITGLKLAGLRIKDPGCVAKTYPRFFEDLAAACK